MPNLQKEGCAMGFHFLDNPRPRTYLILGVDARLEGIPGQGQVT